MRVAAIKYDYIAIEDGTRTIAHVFVAPQDLSGLDIGSDEKIDPDTDAKTISGDIFIGNETDGAFTIEFSITIDNSGVEGPLQFGDQEYEMSNGRCFVVGTGYEISQLPCTTKDEGFARLKN